MKPKKAAACPICESACLEVSCEVADVIKLPTIQIYQNLNHILNVTLKEPARIQLALLVDFCLFLAQSLLTGNYKVCFDHLIVNVFCSIPSPPPKQKKTLVQSQVELDLKRLRDPLQLQLPVQQLTASKD